ncbi:hypothetical protein [Flavobacterium sp. IMCC34518]|jgi:hypothetical protein|uniref:hypothetical protein n=1 Tax=Flavobacterium sp. IMCC34518 TaxID=3003623 RepID=UPI0024822BC4|nr:hypothetical protein [Flavobacterium sp. IMCC34518]
MKHIKKKFLFHEFLQETGDNIFTKEFEEIPLPQNIDSQKILQAAKGHVGLIKSTNGENIFSMVYRDNGTYCMIPVPDFSLMNYHQAYKYNIDRKELRKELIRHFRDLNSEEYKNFAFSYEFQGCASSCVIMLFTSLECFVNDIIPADFKYIIPDSKRTEIYNKEQIQEFIPFMDKLKKVLPKALGKDFFSKQTAITNHIHNLKDLRNAIVHTKSDPTGQNHAEILRKLLDFRYDETFRAITTYFNFYKEGFVEDCVCDEDW